ncbi:CapA family protein [Embleya sp. NPDC005575]|uniref:CapA family protein n=1 Tax=Embleya sp. NPDC005575 TaxID=3156892 RepID=UPI0033B01004
MKNRHVTLCLCGDVMLGRGIDQILPHPGDPSLREGFVGDARDYVRLAEEANGPIPRPVGFRWPWGDALDVLDAEAPDVRIVNLETGITTSDDFEPFKAVHYRMHPDNIPCLEAVRPDVCVLANNHVLDFGRAGLAETLDVLRGAGLRTAGAGGGIAEARRPAVVPVGEGGRVVVFSQGMPSSGVPPDWAATENRSGVDFTHDASERGAAELVARVGRAKLPGDIVVASVHWGPNWGYDIERSQTRYARRLIDGGVDVVHGHSSHHPRAIHVYRNKLILYGCGDCVDDYEGIRGYESYRDDLRLLYIATVARDTGELAALRMAPLRAVRMRLRRAPRVDVEWLATTLTRAGRPFGTEVGPEPDDCLVLHR